MHDEQSRESKRSYGDQRQQPGNGGNTPGALIGIMAGDQRLHLAAGRSDDFAWRPISDHLTKASAEIIDDPGVLRLIAQMVGESAHSGPAERDTFPFAASRCTRFTDSHSRQQHPLTRK